MKHGGNALCSVLSGSLDLDELTITHCQTETVRALLSARPALHLPDNSSGRFALRVARLKSCDEALGLLAATEKRAGR